MHFKLLQTEVPRESTSARRTVKLDERIVCHHDQLTTSALAVLIFSTRLVWPPLPIPVTNEMLCLSIVLEYLLILFIPALK